jgi:hypothetical protein
MNDEDRKYLREAERMRPSFEVFSKMVRILVDEKDEIDQLMLRLDTSLLQTYKTI